MIGNAGGVPVVAVWYGAPDDTYVPAERFVVGQANSGVAIVPGDFNRDGKIDFAVSNGSDSRISTFLNATPTAPCQTQTEDPSVTVCQPQDITYLNSPVHWTATSHDSNLLTAMQLYVDDALMFASASDRIDTDLSLSPGNHFIVTKGWDVTGASFRSDRRITVYDGIPGQTCATSMNTVIICLPEGESTVGSPVRIFAAGESSLEVTAIQVYIDGALDFDDHSGTNYVDKLFTLSPGQHQVEVKLWDAGPTPHSATEFFQVE